MAKGITESTVEEIKARIDLADLIASCGIQVKTAGASKKAYCPFHHEKTHSFNINENRGYYHCFGCGESGDAIKFVQKMDGLTFVEAVKKLAEQCGVKIEEKEDPAAGIIKGPTRPGDLGYHRFGGRLMFSIKDKQGRVVGFSGRQLVASKNSGKYVNSPETLVFKKSNILYGFDKAAGAVTKTPNHEVIEHYKFCPLGKELCAYVARQAKTLAETKPDFFMVDDDTRLITGFNGCYSPLHLAEMKRLTGRVLLDGAAAIALTRRGFSGLIGVEAKPWTGFRVSGEKYAFATLSGGVAESADLNKHDAKAQVVTLENPEVVFAQTPGKVERLGNDGRWLPVAFDDLGDGRCRLKGTRSRPCVRQSSVGFRPWTACRGLATDARRARGRTGTRTILRYSRTMDL